MAIAGVAWGFYSLLGRTARDPLAATTGAFLLCVPAVIIVNLAAINIGVETSSAGLSLAIASGAISSGLGYVVWYAALPGLYQPLKVMTRGPRCVARLRRCALGYR